MFWRKFEIFWAALGCFGAAQGHFRAAQGHFGPCQGCFGAALGLFWSLSAALSSVEQFEAIWGGFRALRVCQSLSPALLQLQGCSEQFRGTVWSHPEARRELRGDFARSGPLGRLKGVGRGGGGLEGWGAA